MPEPPGVLYRVGMSSAPSSTPDAWHAQLAETDVVVRSAIDAHSLKAENTALHQRLDALMAELRIARSAVAVRDAILRDQDACLAERTAALDTRELEAQAARADLTTIRSTRSWLLTQRAARLVRAPRGLLHR